MTTKFSVNLGLYFKVHRSYKENNTFVIKIVIY